MAEETRLKKPDLNLSCKVDLGTEIACAKDLMVERRFNGTFSIFSDKASDRNFAFRPQCLGFREGALYTESFSKVRIALVQILLTV